MVFRRATLPEPGPTSLRLQFDNIPVELPPPLSPIHPLMDHTYVTEYTCNFDVLNSIYVGKFEKKFMNHK